MPRDRAYWEAKLQAALEDEDNILALEPERSYPHPSEVGVKRRDGRFELMVWQWERSQRAKRCCQRRLIMLRTTKIPYYEARILALTPTALDRVLADPLREP